MSSSDLTNPSHVKESLRPETKNRSLHKMHKDGGILLSFKSWQQHEMVTTFLDMYFLQGKLMTRTLRKQKLTSTVQRREEEKTKIMMSINCDLLWYQSASSDFATFDLLILSLMAKKKVKNEFKFLGNLLLEKITKVWTRKVNRSQMKSQISMGFTCYVIDSSVY